MFGLADSQPSVTTLYNQVDFGVYCNANSNLYGTENWGNLGIWAQTSQYPSYTIEIRLKIGGAVEYWMGVYPSLSRVHTSSKTWTGRTFWVLYDVHTNSATCQTGVAGCGEVSDAHYLFSSDQATW